MLADWDSARSSQLGSGSCKRSECAGQGEGLCRGCVVYGVCSCGEKEKGSKTMNSSTSPRSSSRLPPAFCKNASLQLATPPKPIWCSVPSEFCVFLGLCARVLWVWWLCNGRGVSAFPSLYSTSSIPLSSFFKKGLSPRSLPSLHAQATFQAARTIWLHHTPRRAHPPQRCRTSPRPSPAPYTQQQPHPTSTTKTRTRCLFWTPSAPPSSSSAPRPRPPFPPTRSGRKR